MSIRQARQPGPGGGNCRGSERIDRVPADAPPPQSEGGRCPPERLLSSQAWRRSEFPVGGQPKGVAANFAQGLGEVVVSVAQAEGKARRSAEGEDGAEIECSLEAPGLPRLLGAEAAGEVVAKGPLEFAEEARRGQVALIEGRVEKSEVGLASGIDELRFQARVSGVGGKPPGSYEALRKRDRSARVGQAIGPD